MSDIKQCKHGRNFCCECHMAEDLKSVREAMKLDNQRIYPAGTSRDLQGELNEAQSQLAALREELVKFDEGMRALACSLGAGGYNSETLTADQLVGKVQWGIDDIITVQEQRLADADRRNAVLSKALKTIREESDDIGACECAADALTDAAPLSPDHSGGGAGMVLPSNCRQRLASEGKPYPRSSCEACGKFSPKWRECDAAIDKVKELNQ